jgi:DNA-binding response OmpR family regulator
MLPYTRILIVDDEANLRRTVAIGLRLEGFEVVEAGDGLDALCVLDEVAVDIALVDLMMPRMNGLDLARQMRLRHPGVQVVLTSAYHLSRRQLELAGVDVVGFVPKPYDLPELTRFLSAKADLADRVPA